MDISQVLEDLAKYAQNSEPSRDMLAVLPYLIGYFVSSDVPMAALPGILLTAYNLGRLEATIVWQDSGESDSA